MPEQIEIPLAWCWYAAQPIWVLVLVLGIFSAAAPGRSIGFYQWIMARFNWRVQPIDEAREIRMTRVMGWVLILLGAVLAWRVSLLRVT